MMKIKPLLKLGLKIGIALILTAWLLAQVDLGRLSQVAQKGNILMLFCGCIFFLLCWVWAEGLRLHVLIKEYMNGFLSTLRLLIESHFVNYLLPSNIGGDGYKIHYLTRNREMELSKSLAFVFLERLAGMLVIFSAGLIYLLINKKKILTPLLENIHFSLPFQPGLLLVIIVLVAALAAFVFILKQDRFREFLRRACSALAELSWSKLLQLFLLTIIFNLLRIISLYFYAAWLNETVLITDFIFVVFFTTFACLLPISFGAMGIREGAMTLSLSLFGVNSTNAILMSFLDRILLLLLALLGAIFFLFSHNLKKIRPASKTINKTY